MEGLSIETRTTRSLIRFAGLFVVLAAAVGVRLLAARNDLWFDEIISVELSSLMSNWIGAFTEFRYDNNHYLNTIWIYGLGSQRHPLLYRTLSIVAGLATIAAVYWTLKPYGSTAQKIGVVLFAFSYPQIHYATEARGYALQILFCLLAFGCLDRFHRDARFRYAWGFGIFASLALLSHLLTINFLMACGFWSISFQFSQIISPSLKAKRLVACHLLPFLCGLVLYYASIRFLEIGGGPKLNTLLVLTSAWSSLFYYASQPWLRVCVGMLTLVFMFAGLWVHRENERQRNQSSENWKFLMVFLILIPLVRVTIPGGLLFVRYFLLQLSFCLWLFSVLLADLADRRGQKQLVAAILVLFVLLNLGQTSRLLRYGRGDYQTALKMMIDETSGSRVTIASSNNVHDVPVIAYFAAVCDPESELIQTVDPDSHPEWYILHRTMTTATNMSQPPQEITLADTRYVLRQHYPASYLSGFDWCCYRKSVSESKPLSD